MKKNLSPREKPSSLPLPATDFKALFESIPGLYLILNWDLSIFAVSNAYLAATMTKREYIIGKYVFDVFPDNPKDPNSKASLGLFASFEKVLKTGKADSLSLLRYDIRKPKSKGGEFEERYWNVINSACTDKKGNMIYIIHHVEDVTEIARLNQQKEEQLKENKILRINARKKEAEAFARIQSSEIKLKSLVDTILDTLIDGVVTFDQHGKIQSYNKACIRLFGYSANEIINRDMNILMPETSRQEYDGYFRHENKNEFMAITGIAREVSGQRKDGSIFPMELAIGETKQGGSHAYVAIIRDISERKEAEKIHEQLLHVQKLESLGKLTGGIAHDFNNLLAVIMGNLDFMAEQLNGDSALLEYIKPCLEAAQNGAELTKQLLAFGRKQALQPKIISVNDLLHYFITLVKHTIGERVEVKTILEPELWNVNVDPNQLQNALLNLAVNARDAMPEGGKLIFETHNINLDNDYAEAQVDISPGDYVLIASSDTGAGMAADVIEKAFEPFFTTKEIGKGSGLGLSMVYGFVKQSKGHITLYSEPGYGTSIKIYLPRAEQGKATVKEHILSHSLPAEKKSQTILVVEDNKKVLKLTSSMVEKLGYTVVKTETGDQAINIIKAHPEIVMLLTDVMLPGALNGPQLAKEAHEHNPNIKILFNSGYAEQSIMQTGLLEEGVNLITKPFRIQQLAAKIEEVMKQSNI